MAWINAKAGVRTFIGSDIQLVNLMSWMQEWLSCHILTRGKNYSDPCLDVDFSVRAREALGKVGLVEMG